ncbi:conserved domain protein [Eggerthella sp. HGA1]|nr:conserved domain protein [Eggerthella sp. HGA1]
MIGFKSAGRSDAGFLRRRATSGLDSLVRASASRCMHGAFESEPLHCIRVFRQKSTEILHVARDLHKESEVPKPPKPRQRTNVSRETFGVGRWGGRARKSPAPGGRWRRARGGLQAERARERRALTRRPARDPAGSRR